MILIIAEKPDAGSHIAKVVNTTNIKKDGYIEGDNFIVTWGYGHLVQQFLPEDYDPKFKSWKIDDLPILPKEFKYKSIQSGTKQLSVIKSLLDRNDITEVINACDADREGELIFRLIYNYCKSVKPVKRAWILSFDEKDLEKTFLTLKNGSEYDNLYAAAVSRQTADFVIGMNFTRLQTILYGTKLTVGRVQTPLLSAISERDIEIESFIPKDYFMINGIFDSLGTSLYIGSNNKFESKEEAEKILESLKTVSKGKITVFDKTRKSIEIPLLYDLAGLQKVCANKFNFDPTYTLKLIQELYEKHKVLTYPRTESKYLPESFRENFLDLIEIIAKDNNSEITKSILSDHREVNGKIFDDSKVKSHHAIIITGKSIKGLDLSADCLTVYNLVTQSMLLQYLGKYIYDQTKIEINAKDHIFKVIGNKMIDQGFRKLFGLGEDEEEPKVIPHGWELDKVVSLDKVELLSKKTTPPSRFSKSTIIDFMEAKNLGTAATRSGILDKLKNVEFIIYKGKNIISTDKGRKLISVVDEKIKDIGYTSNMEIKLKEIADGVYSKELFLSDIQRYVSMVVGLVAKDSDVSFSKSESIGVCPICESGVTESYKAFGCEGKDCKFVIWKEDKFLSSIKVKVNKTFVTNFCKGKGKIKVKAVSKAGKNFECTLTLSDEGNKYLKWNMSFDK